MEFMDVIRKRRSIRKYRAEKIPEAKMANILESVRLAPSGSNRQPWKFIVVRDKEKKAKLAEAANKQMWTAEADFIAVCCWLPVQGIEEMRLRRDVTIATEHLVLAAANEGLGACWIGAFNVDSVRSVLGLPQDVGVNSLVAVGYPAEEGRPKITKKLEEIVSYDSFG